MKKQTPKTKKFFAKIVADRESRNYQEHLADNGMVICPLCKDPYPEELCALSRADNKTHICPQCGKKML